MAIKYNYSKKDLLKIKSKINEEIKSLYAKLGDAENEFKNADMNRHYTYCAHRENRYQKYLFFIELFYNQYKDKIINKDTFNRAMIYLDMLVLTDWKKEIENRLLKLEKEKMKKCQNQ